MAHSKKTKEEFLRVLERCMGNVKETCKKQKIGRRTFYNWMEVEEFKQRVEEIQEGLKDDAESALRKAIREGNVTATIFFLKTRCQDRGYIERQQHDHKHQSEAPQTFKIGETVIKFN